MEMITTVEHLKLHERQSQFLSNCLIDNVNEKELIIDTGASTTTSESVQPKSAMEREDVQQESKQEQKQSLVTKKKRRTYKSDRILNQVYQSLKNNFKNGFAYCALCNKWIKASRVIARESSSVSAWVALQHVHSHSDKVLFCCRHCQHSSKTMRVMHNHVVSQHMLPGKNNFIDLTADHQNEIMETITRCFDYHQSVTIQECFQKGVPNYNYEKRGLTVKEATQSMQANDEETPPLATDQKKQQDESASIRQAHCRQLSLKFQNAGNAKCRQCQKTIVLKSKIAGGLDSVRLIDHVCRFHLNKPMYVCRRCQEPCKSYCAIQCHAFTKHKTTKVKGQYDDYSNQFHQEILIKLSECFDWSEKTHKNGQTSSCNSVPTVDWTDQKIDVEVKNETAIRQLLVFTKQLCQNALKNSGISKTINCQLCPQSIVCTGDPTSNSKKLINHVLVTHIKKLVYRCRRCCEYSTSYQRLRNHLKIKHDTWKVVGEYDYLSTNRQDEIKLWLSGCFGANCVEALAIDNAIEQKQENRPISAIGSYQAGSSYENATTSMDFGANVGELEKFRCQFCSFSTGNAVLLRNHLAIIHCQK